MCTTSADLGGCALTNTKCLCTNQAFIASTTPCIQKSCTDPKDLTDALAASQALCAAAVRILHILRSMPLTLVLH